MGSSNMFRRLIPDFKEYPATMALCTLWVIVFLMMSLTALQSGRPVPPNWVLLGMGNGHEFGDETLNELTHGEVWRVITSTFVHFGILHVGMNLYGMYQLGCMVESWYGPGQFLAVYMLIGGGGNLLSGLIRHELRRLVGDGRGLPSMLHNWLVVNPEIHSAGGSTVVIGLVALCAVVGWRSKTRIGDYLRSQMVGILVFTALLGQMLPIIDNWGHVGGALVGAGIGFAHRILIRTTDRPWAKWAGALCVALLAVCALAQVRDNRREALDRQRQVLALVKFLHRRATFPRLIRRGYSMLRNPVRQTSKPLVLTPVRGKPSAEALSPKKIDSDLILAIALMDSQKESLSRGPTARDFQRVRTLLAAARADPPTEEEYREFDYRLDAIVDHVKKKRQAYVSLVRAP